MGDEDVAVCYLAVVYIMSVCFLEKKDCQLELNFEQHGFELPRFTYRWIFFFFEICDNLKNSQLNYTS